MGGIQLYQLLLLFALGGAVYLVYLRGNRKNKELIKTISSELELAVNPVEKVYKNLGGTIGYRAFYERKGIFNRVVAVFTTLPRHSIIVYPFHLIFRGHDKLQLNAYSQKDISPNFLFVRDGIRYNNLHQRYKNRGMSIENYNFKSIRFVMYYDDEYSHEICEEILKVFDPRFLVAIGANPENRVFYLYCIPVKGKIEPMVRHFLSHIKQYVIK